MIDRDPALLIADRWQRGFPLCERPFARIGAALGRPESEILDGLADLQQRRILSRIGAVVRPNAAGASTLGALSCPPQHLDEVAAIVSAEASVNHNYERDHRINLWFVVAAASEFELAATLSRISSKTGCDILDLRLEQPYHIDLGFGLGVRGPKVLNGAVACRPASPQERAVLVALEDGLPLVPRPFAAVAEAIGMMESAVSAALQTMMDDGIISRFGCVIRHREVGFTANAMAVWDIPDAAVDGAGRTLAADDGVTLCYRRNRQAPHWPYNLFAMIHGKREADVRDHIADLADRAGLLGLPHDVLFSRRCFTQRGARFAPPIREAAA